MSSYHFTPHLVMFLVLCTDCVYSQAHYITPSRDDPCPQHHCVTLTMFASISNDHHSNADGNQTNISLLFLSGNHTLGQDISLAHKNNVLMTTELYGEVTIECFNTSGRLDISNTTSATIKNLHFVGCSGNTFTKVKNLSFENTMFEGAEGKLTSLVLIEVDFAIIVKASFLSNTNSNTFRINRQASLYKTINNVFQKTKRFHETGGALNVAFSNISINDSKFSQNRAEIGGVLVAHNSSLYFVRSAFDYNRAKFGGVMATSESMVIVDNSTFTGNMAELIGGAIMSHKDTFSISSTITTNSYARNAGVLTAYKSSLRVTGSTFSNNAASKVCGVMCAAKSTFSIRNTKFTNSKAKSGGVIGTILGNSSFNISNSVFSNNSAYDYGGAMEIYYDDTSFYITNCTFKNNKASYGGVMDTSDKPTFTIINSTFANNRADKCGGVMITYDELSLSIMNCNFSNNKATYGGVMKTHRSSFSITSIFSKSAADEDGVSFMLNISNSNFVNNRATYGGIMFTSGKSSFIINNCTFINNRATDEGGVLRSFGECMFVITQSIFSNNTAECGGVMNTHLKASFNIIGCIFANNWATDGGVIQGTSDDSNFTIINSTFTNNSAMTKGGVVRALGTSQLLVINSNFTHNRAEDGGVFIIYTKILFTANNSMFSFNEASNYGGVICTWDESSFTVTNSKFTHNKAHYGGVMDILDNSSFTVRNGTFTSNRAHEGAVIRSWNGSFNIYNSTFNSNFADGLMFVVLCTIVFTDCKFDQNVGSLYVFTSTLEFSGYNQLENCAEHSSKFAPEETIIQEGGAVTSYMSRVTFTGESVLLNNSARYGGAILTTESKIAVQGEITIVNNRATNNGGGISLLQSEFDIKGRCNISHNYAVSGGGIHAISSLIAVHQQGALHFINNSAVNGGGVYLEVNPKLYILKYNDFKNNNMLLFKGNHASKCGGAIYVEDFSNTHACSPNVECFIQALSLFRSDYSFIANMQFSGNTANEQGPDIFGGLFDRCIPSPYAELYLEYSNTYMKSGLTYLQNISNISLDSIASPPLRVCFCNNKSKADCHYQPPPLEVMRGETFTVSLVAVDQVNRTIEANITSSLSSIEGGIGEGQQTQPVGRNCMNLTFNVFSPLESEKVNLHPDGPCSGDTHFISQVTVNFLDCTCPIGFEPLSYKQSSTKCTCICDSKLTPYITTCNFSTSSLLRVKTKSWISVINANSDRPTYLIYPTCPFDYCQLPHDNVSMNLNLSNGADAQCAYNRSGVLCGECQQNYSLSLGSSRCLPCHSHWPAAFAAILIAALLAGILLVAVLLFLNMTVAVGLINCFIFYANIVAANSAAFFPLSKPSFPYVLVAWLNLEIGIDVCFLDRLDMYTKTWLQLVFPVYIICLVVIIIKISEYSPRFATLIGRRDPISTLATLILLSYGKLLSVTITALAFAILHYPNGTQEIVWLPDGNVKYFQGKHIPLFLVAVVIIIIGAPYTILLLLWQWLVRAPSWKLLKWTRNTKLHAIITTHHAPYNSKYRYWTGLLLLARVVLFITECVTMSANPHTPPLLTIFVIGGLFILKGVIGLRVYRKLLIDIVDTVLCFNLLALAGFSLYDFKSDLKTNFNWRQKAVAHTSAGLTLLLLIGVVLYHVFLLTKRNKPQRELNEHLLTPIQPNKPEITHSTLELPAEPAQSSSHYEDELDTKEGCDDQMLDPLYQLMEDDSETGL